LNIARQTDFVDILWAMPQPYLVLDSHLVIVGATDAYLEATDRHRNDIVGRHILEAFPENPDAAGTVEQGPLEVSLRHVLATGKPHQMAVIQYDIPKPNGGFYQRFWTPVHSPVLGEDGAVRYIIQDPMDVTESVLKRQEDDARLRVALHAADLGAWEYEPETDIWRRSPSVDEFFGFAPGKGGPVAAPFFARIHESDLKRVQEELRAVVGRPDQTTMKFDYRIRLPSGNIRHVSSRGEVLRTSDGTVRMIGVRMDVTAERVREDELAAAVAAQRDLLAQKDVLLAEVNHRVKNSLQLVVSTLRLQSRRLEHPSTMRAFERAISRVRAIISVHERLYRTENTLTVDMAEHLRRLVLDVAEAQDLQIGLELADIELPTERAIPLSVIVNELLTAAMDSQKPEGKMHLMLRELRDGNLELSLSGTSCELATSGSLTQKLVSAMALQIAGTLEFDDAIRTVTMTFPRDAS